MPPPLLIITFALRRYAFSLICHYYFLPLITPRAATLSLRHTLFSLRPLYLRRHYAAARFLSPLRDYSDFCATAMPLIAITLFAIDSCH